MSLQQKLLEQKDLYFRNKQDVRFLKEAILFLTFGYIRKNNDKESIEWIYEALDKELGKKASTQDRYERIGALVSYIVSHGADVLTTIKAVSEWLRIADTIARDGYYKIRNTYGIDPKTDSVMECRDFRIKYSRVPLEFVRELYNEGRNFPGDSADSNNEYKRVNEAMYAACETAHRHDRAMYDLEMTILKAVLGQKDDESSSAPGVGF